MDPWFSFVVRDAHNGGTTRVVRSPCCSGIESITPFKPITATQIFFLCYKVHHKRFILKLSLKVAHFHQAVTVHLGRREVPKSDWGISGIILLRRFCCGPFLTFGRFAIQHIRRVIGVNYVLIMYFFWMHQEYNFVPLMGEWFWSLQSFLKS